MAKDSREQGGADPRLIIAILALIISFLGFMFGSDVWNRYIAPWLSTWIPGAPLPMESCVPGKTCAVTFSQLPPSIWCMLPESGYETQNSQLVFSTNRDQKNEFQLCPKFRTNLRWAEVDVRIDQFTGSADNGFVTLQGATGTSGYAGISMFASGKINICGSPKDGSCETYETSTVTNPKNFHTLRMEWKDHLVSFALDGAPLKTKIPVSGSSSWFLFGATSWDKGMVTARFSQVRVETAP